MSLKVLILGANGFIGNALVAAILQQTDWQVFGLDIHTDKLQDSLGHERLQFIQGDMNVHQDWIAEQVQKCDAVLPLVAIANPAIYVQDPLRVFELDFEANLKIVRYCVQYQTRLIFPSTSEVYGMCPDREFDEETSALVLGPIQKERWIYSCSKQLLDRVIYAYGQHQNLRYTLFRPFNWIGPKQDNVYDSKAGSSRVVSQFISNIIHGKDIQLVDGGRQRRSFTFIDDCIDCLLKIIANKNGAADNRIFNIGNPNNDASIKELAELLLAMAKTYPALATKAEQIKIMEISGDAYYGSNYQDVSARLPSIKNAQQFLGWEPKIDFKTALQKTLGYYAAEL